MIKPSVSSRILYKTLVEAFYRQHAGLFFVLLYFCLGFLRAQEHLLLIRTALQSFPLLAGVWLLWSVYGCLCLYFSRHSLQQRHNQFLYHLRLFPAGRQRLMLGHVFALQFLPVLLYAFLMAGVAFVHQLWVPGLLCLLFLLLLIAMGVLLNQHFLRNPGSENILLQKMGQRIQISRKPAFSLPLFSLFFSHKFSVALSKTASCFFLVLVGHLYLLAPYDGRFALLAIVLAGLGNTMLLYQVHHFNEKQLPLQRNFPQPIYRRFLNNSLLIVLLLLPETILIIRHFHAFFQPSTLFVMVLFLISFAQFLYGYLYIRDFQKEKLMLHAFGIGLFYYFVIIFNIPSLLIAGVNVLLAYLFFTRYYYRFEAEV